MLSQLSAGNIPVSGNGLEQNVHIDATFPNVTSAEHSVGGKDRRS